MTRDVGEALSEKHKKEKAENRAMLLKIISSVGFCAGRDYLYEVMMGT